MRTRGNRDRTRYLLADGEGQVVEVQEELAGHLVRVLRAAVGVLLLQEVHLQCDGAHALPGLVKLVAAHCRPQTDKMDVVVVVVVVVGTQISVVSHLSYFSNNSSVSYPSNEG